MKSLPHTDTKSGERLAFQSTGRENALKRNPHGVNQVRLKLPNDSSDFALLDRNRQRVQEIAQLRQRFPQQAAAQAGEERVPVGSQSPGRTAEGRGPRTGGKVERRDMERRYRRVVRVAGKRRDQMNVMAAVYKPANPIFGDDAAAIGHKADFQGALRSRWATCAASHGGTGRAAFCLGCLVK